MNMTKIRAFLEAQGIEYQERESSNGYIEIMLERDCIWVNGFGEDMHYDKKISIYKNNYGDYIIMEVVGYNQSKKLFWGRKQIHAIEVLKRRLEV